MLSTFATGFGFIMLAVGLLGFVPGVTDPDGNLLGIFHVNVAHNVIHLLTGMIALACGLDGANAARIFFRVFGALYGLIGLLGLYQGDTILLGMVANNMADAWLHLSIAAVALVLGFVPVVTPHTESQLPHQPPTPLPH